MSVLLAVAHSLQGIWKICFSCTFFMVFICCQLFFNSASCCLLTNRRRWRWLKFYYETFLHTENKHVPPLPSPHSFPLALPVASFALLSIRLIIKYSMWHEFSSLPATKCERDKNKERERKLKFVSFLRKKNSINCNRWFSVCCKMRILCCVWKAD